MTAGALLSGLGALGAAAQQPVVIGGSGQPDVFVNMQVLNSLGPGPAYPSPYGYAAPATPYGYAAPYGYGAPVASYNGFTPQYVTRPGTLLYPPPSPPQSHVTLQLPGSALQPSASFEQPSVALTPPATREPVTAEPMTPPAPSEAAPSMTAPPAPAPAPQVAERAPEPAAEAAPAPKPVAKPAAEPEPEVPAIPPPGMETTEAPPPAPPAAPQEAAPAPEAPAPAPESKQAATSEPEQAPATSGGLAPPPPPEAPAEPQPETAASDLPEAPQTATLTPGPEEGLLRLSFGEGSADLNEEAKESLRAMATTLLEDGNARVQLLAYASSADNSASRARRLSLSRALAVRAFLIDQGVRSTRMDVRALGSKAEGGPADRVDILPAQR